MSSKQNNTFTATSGLVWMFLLLAAISLPRFGRTLPINQALITHMQAETADILKIRCDHAADRVPITDNPSPAERSVALLAALDGRCNQAFRQWQTHLQVKPADRLGWLSVGQIQRIWANQSGMVTAFQLADAAPLFAMRAQQANDPQTAAQWMSLAALISPDVGYTLDLARIHLAADDSEHARTVLEQRLAQTVTRSVDGLRLAAALAEVEQDWPMAVTLYQQLLAQEPANYALLQRAKSAAEQAADYDEAIAVTGQLIRYRYGDVGWWMLEAARLETRRGNYEAAEAWIDQGQSLYLGDPWIISFYRAQNECAAGNLEATITHFDQAKAAQPANWQIPANEALCLRRLTNDLERALPLLQAAAVLGNGRPETRQIQLSLAEWYLEAGNSAAAQAQYERILQQFPGDTAAREALVEMQGQ